MKFTLKFTFLLVLLAALALPGTALARGLQDDRVVAGGTFTLRSGQTQDGNLLIMGGAVTLEEGSLVNGDVVLMGGTLAIAGTVSGDIVGIGGVVSLRASAVVQGDLTTMAATLNRDPGSVVSGQIVTGFRGFRGLQPPFQFNFPDGEGTPTQPNVQVNVSPVWDGIWFLFRTFMWAALAVLLVMFLPNQIERTAQAVVSQPVLAGAVGLLTSVVAPLLLIGLAITILLIPVSLIGGAVLVVAWFLGRIALGLEIGRRMALNLRQDWPLAVAAGIGTFVLTLVVDGIGHIVPCIGWIFPLLVSILGLGGVLLTRFGTQAYPPPHSYYPVSPPPARPMPPQAPARPGGAAVYEQSVPPPSPDYQAGPPESDDA
jgi:hypothetical protein